VLQGVQHVAFIENFLSLPLEGKVGRRYGGSDEVLPQYVFATYLMCAYKFTAHLISQKSKIFDSFSSRRSLN